MPGGGSSPALRRVRWVKRGRHSAIAKVWRMMLKLGPSYLHREAPPCSQASSKRAALCSAQDGLPNFTRFTDKWCCWTGASRIGPPGGYLVRSGLNMFAQPKSISTANPPPREPTQGYLDGRDASLLKVCWSRPWDCLLSKKTKPQMEPVCPLPLLSPYAALSSTSQPRKDEDSRRPPPV